MRDIYKHPCSRHHGISTWTPWRASVGREAAGEAPWRIHSRIGNFRYIAGLATVGLMFIVARGFLVGYPAPWADLANAVFFLFLMALSFYRQSWLRTLCWLGLASLFFNTSDEVMLATGDMCQPYLFLLPLLVLYGALLGDIWISLAAIFGVHAIYVYTWLCRPLHDRQDVFVLTNLCMVTVLTAVASFGVWTRHRQLLRQLDLQAGDLRREVDTRLQLHALIVHDIRNPLTVLLNAVAVDDRQQIKDMAQRICAIIESTAGLAEGAAITRSDVTLEEICAYLKVIFSARWARKNQSLKVTGDPHLSVATDLTILCSSVLSNALNNAMKFSPRGAVIEIAAESTEGGVRIAVNDQGPGLPPEVLVRGPEGRSYPSLPGSEGETGSGYGLRIAALCAERLGGVLEVRNRVEGGAAVSIVLPNKAVL